MLLDNNKDDVSDHPERCRSRLIHLYRKNYYSRDYTLESNRSVMDSKVCIEKITIVEIILWNP